jgi:hypothetical protein
VIASEDLGKIGGPIGPAILPRFCGSGLGLEEDGLIHREVYRVPPKVECSLTEHGTSLNTALGPLGTWGTERAKRLAAESAVAPTASRREAAPS